MKNQTARVHALELAMRHHGERADLQTIFSTADRFSAYIIGEQQPKQVQWNATQIADLIICRDNPIAFLKKASISHPAKGAILFQPYTFQENLIRSINDEQFSAVCHGRQMGISTCLCLYALWLATFRENETTLIVAPSLALASDCMERIRYAYESLPAHLKARATTYNKHMIQFDNGSRIVARSIAPDTGRGVHIDNLFIMDAAYISHSKGYEFWTALMPCLSRTGHCIMASAANDTNGIFYDVCQRAPDNGFTVHRLPWTLHPERDISWAKPYRDAIGEAKWRREFECEFVQVLPGKY